MLWNLGVEWLFIALAVVGILSFILGLALDSIIGDDGFGGTGNALIMSAGFFLTIFVANSLGYNLREVKLAMIVGLAGAFGGLFVLAATKTVLGRG